jgi:hypothetical protein
MYSRAAVLESNAENGSRKMMPKRGRFLSVTSSMPSSCAGSNISTRWRFERHRLARKSSRIPFVNGKKNKFPPSAAGISEFRAQARPQPSFTAPLVRPPLGIAEQRSLDNWKAGRTSGREGRLRSSACSKLRRIGRGTRRLRSSSIADGHPDSQQASQQCPRRQRLLAFEPTTLAGARSVTIKIICIHTDDD